MWPIRVQTWRTREPGQGWHVAAFTAEASPEDRQREFFRQGTDATPCNHDGPVALRRTPKMSRLEAVLLVADRAMSTRRLAQLAKLASPAEAGRLVERLNQAYFADASAFRIERVATGYRLLTRPEFSNWLNRLHNRKSQLKLSNPALETLSIIAYRQPITRADVEAIRGVQSTDILRLLMDRGLVRIGGEEESLGRPYLYETTRQFLELFGLRDLDDLPNALLLRLPAMVAEDEVNGEGSGEEVSGESEPEVDDDDWDDDWEDDWEDDEDS